MHDFLTYIATNSELQVDPSLTFPAYNITKVLSREL